MAQKPANVARVRQIGVARCRTFTVWIGLRRPKSLRRLGGRTRARTWDPMIKSHLLYQLSYAPGTGSGKPSQEGVVYQSDPAMSSKAAGGFPAFATRPER